MKMKVWTIEEIETIISDLKKPYTSLREISRNRHKQFNRGVSGTLIKIIQINKAINKGFTASEIAGKTTSEKYKRVDSGLVNFYHKEEIDVMNSMIATGQPITEIADILSIKFNRPVVGLKWKLYNLKKDIPYIKTWNSPRKKIQVVKKTTNVKQNLPKPLIEQKSADIGVEVPHGMTFEGKPKRITLHSDHFRIYF